MVSDIKETSSSRHNMICVDIWAHRDCDSTLKTCTGSNQTDSQHWEGGMDTKSTLNKNQFANDNLLGNGQLVFSGFMPIQKWTPVILCVLFVFVVLFYLIGVFVAFFFILGGGEKQHAVEWEGRWGRCERSWERKKHMAKLYCIRKF